MEDLVDRGTVTQLPGGQYQIAADILGTGRSSITIGAAVGGDKRRFNLKWLYEYPWLRFDHQCNAMICAICKQCKRANQFAKRGSRNFKTSALVDHSSSNDHQKSIVHFGGAMPGPPSADGVGVALGLEDDQWLVRPLDPGTLAAAAAGARPDARQSEPAPLAQTDVPDLPEQQPCADPAPSLPAAVEAEGGATLEKMVDRHMVAQQSNTMESYITTDSITPIASRLTPTREEQLADELTLRHQQRQQQHGDLHPQPADPTGAAMPAPGSRSLAPTEGLAEASIQAVRKASRQMAGGSGSHPDEKYTREFGHAVQALLQAMRLNLSISSVPELYRLQMQPTPLSAIGSMGAQTRENSELRLAGALTNSTEAARTLQHVVSSEILSLVKDEVSQSPAFSIIIEEAPLREHNSLVAHVLLYLRYMRRDPMAKDGLQVVTRFWRCVHLYHEHEGRVARRDATGLVLTLLERARIDASRLVSISCERPVSREDEEAERRRQPHVIHWHGIFTYANSLSPQVYEEITHRSEDFVHFAMTLMDLCLFMYSHPTSFAFLGADFQEMLYKTLYEIFLGEGSLSTRLPISLTPAIVIAITRNIAQIMATVVALSKTPIWSDAATSSDTIPDSGGDIASPAPKSPRSSLQIPLPVVDILVSSFGGLGSRKSVGRCPPADALLAQLCDYSFLGCVHFMADILLLVKPVIDIAGRSDMPTGALSAAAAAAGNSASPTLDQQLRAFVETVRDAIESVTLMYGDECGSTDDNDITQSGENNDDEYHGFHLNEFMQLTECRVNTECRFRHFTVTNYLGAVSQANLVELIHTVSSSILHDLHQRFGAHDIATIQAMADMWDPTQFPSAPTGVVGFGQGPAEVLAQHLFKAPPVQSANGQMHGVERAQPNMPLIDATTLVKEWTEFKAEIYGELDEQLRLQQQQGQQGVRLSPEMIQLAYRNKLFPENYLAPSRRRLRSVENNYDTDMHTSKHTKASAWSRYGNLAKLATAWNVLPLALSTDLHQFRRLYERQLSRICREQAENKLQSISFDIGDTFSELLGRLASPHQQNKGRKVTVYDLLQNSKVETDFGDTEMPVLEVDLSGVTINYFLRSIDAVTMALDHRLRLLSLDHMESPLSVPCDPNAYPKWLQNAMRGYWKLACRPFIPSGIKSHTSKWHKRVPSHLASSTNGATISTQSTHTMGGVAGSASTTSQISDHTDAAPSIVASKQLSNSVGGMEFSAHSFAPNGIGKNAHQININALTSYTDASLATQASFLNSSTHQPAASNDISSLPLLEALLSGPNSALPQPQPPMPPPQQQQQPSMPESAPATMSSRLSGLRPPPQPMVPTHSAPADDILLMPSKRTYDVRIPPVSASAAVLRTQQQQQPPQQPSQQQPPMPVYSNGDPDQNILPMHHAQVNLGIPPNKRMRHASSTTVATNPYSAVNSGTIPSNHGGFDYRYQDAMNALHQCQPPPPPLAPSHHHPPPPPSRNPALINGGSQDMNSTIARLASDMGFDPVTH
ncbi:hypothetical protein LPJ66_005518, partial [Kickxella alabastrina]